MSSLELNGVEFSQLSGQILQSGHKLRFMARGRSMQPFILDGDILQVVPIGKRQIKWGDVVLAEIGAGIILAHRVVGVKGRDRNWEYFIKGDACIFPDGWIGAKNILGRVVIVERGEKTINLSSFAHLVRFKSWALIKPWAPRLAWLPERVHLKLRNFLLRCLMSF